MGGVNEKIEGFFELCQKRGLTGEQGVIIPRSNLVNLLLNNAVVEAVAAGQFHIYTVNHVDQALSLLSGAEAGCVDAEGCFPENTINAQVVARLRSISELSSPEESAEK